MKPFLFSLAKTAGEMILDHWKTVQRTDYRSKSAEEVVTQADFIANEYIVARIAKKFPHDDILSEEMPARKRISDRQWIIDPLDGTTNYLIRHPMFAVAIALSDHDEIQCGVIFAPVLNHFFWTERGKGSFHNNHRVSVSPISTLSESILDFPNPHPRHGTMKTLRTHLKTVPFIRSGRHIGSATLSLAYVGAGYIEGTVMIGPNPLWDVAVGSLYVSEAGGRVTDHENKPWTIFSKNLVASNRKIHSQLIHYL